MSRRVLPLLLLSLAVQTARPQARQDPAAERDQAAAIQPPALPAAQSAPAAPVAPPLPGQLKAEPAAAPAPVTPLPPIPMPGAPPPAAPAGPEAKTPVPSVPLPRVQNPSSTSTTGQFIVHGESLTLRSAFSSKCEDISVELRKLLRDKQSWAIPIVVLLSSGDSAAKAGKAVSTQISQLAHGGFHIQVSIHLRPDLRQADIRRELIRAMLAERILRGQKQITSSRSLLLPDWLFTGVIEALDYRSRARPSALFAAIFKSGKIYSIEEIIEASPADLDGLSKSIYQVSSCALLLALIEQPDGGARMGAFLGALASDPRPERDLLNQHFPAIAGTPSSLNKWWSLQLASLASPSMAEPLDLEESLVQLESALTFRYQAKPSEIPRPRPVIASAPAPEPRPRPAAPAVASAEKPAETEDDPATPAKRSFLSRLNPFSKAGREEDPEAVIAAAIEDAALAEVAANNPPQEELDINDKPSLLARIFGRRDEDEAEAPDAPAEPDKATPPQTKAAPVQKPAAESAPAENSTAEEPPEPPRRSRLNPLNWFRKKPADSSEDAPPAAAKDSRSGGTPDGGAAATLSAPAVSALAWTACRTSVTFILPFPGFLPLAPLSPGFDSMPVMAQSFLGIRFGKKKDDSPKDTPAADPAPGGSTGEKPAPPKTDPAPKPKAESKDAPPESPAGTADPAPPPAQTGEEKSTAEEDSEKQSLILQRLRSLLRFGGKKNPSEDPAPEQPQPAPATGDTTPAPTPSPAAPKPKASPPPPPQDEPLVAASVALEDYAAVLRRPDSKVILEQNIRALAALQNRAAIVLRPVIADSSVLLGDLLQGKTKGAPERIRELRRRIREAEALGKAVRSMLDLHEANESRPLSGLFEDYLNLPDTLQKELPERTDPISRYLDSLDREFSGR